MPEASWITAAGENDLTADGPVFAHMSHCKIHADRELNRGMQIHQNCMILNPVKKEKGQTLTDAAADTYSYLVSSVRQPVESLFNWLIGKRKFSLRKD